MDPVSNADRIVALLRRKLMERTRSGARVRAPSDVRALTALEGIGGKPLRRAVIESLLVDHLGPDIRNDAGFQQVVTRVAETIDGDVATAQLLDSVLSGLRSA